MAVSGKLEVTIKINQLPSDVSTAKNGWKEFQVDVGSRSVLISMRPRLWTRVETAAAAHPHWIAVITGQMGEDVKPGCFRLNEPNVQVFEYTPKAPPAQPTSEAEAPPQPPPKET